MKCIISGIIKVSKDVAPLAGAWIEIQKPTNECSYPAVAPLAGAGIEI